MFFLRKIVFFDFFGKFELFFEYFDGCVRIDFGFVEILVCVIYYYFLFRV